MNNLSVRLLAAVGLSTLVLGIAIGVGWQHLHKFNSTASPQNNAIEEAKQEPKVLYWYDPMVPDQHFDKPGPSPFMDMDLVPKYAAPSTQEPGLTVDAALVQNLGMRKAKVQRLPIHNELEVVGQLQFNQRN